MIDRRVLLQRAAALLGGAVSASAAAGVLAGCVATPQADGTASHEWLTPDEARTAAAMADRILPRTDTPGVLDVGGLGFIDRMMAGYYHDRERGVLRDGLSCADREAQAAHGRRFGDLPAEQQIALMTVWDREAYDHNRRNAAGAEAPHFFRMMKELTTLAFFTSEYGASEFLKYAAIPGEWKADIPYSDVGKAWAT